MGSIAMCSLYGTLWCIYIAYRHPLDELFGICTYDKELKRKISNFPFFFLHKNESLRK